MRNPLRRRYGRYLHPCRLVAGKRLRAPVRKKKASPCRSYARSFVVFVEAFKEATMAGFITERDLEQAEEAFPGIVRFFESLSRKPRTFLELVSRYEQFQGPARDVRKAA